MEKERKLNSLKVIRCQNSSLTTEAMLNHQAHKGISRSFSQLMVQSTTIPDGPEMCIGFSAAILRCWCYSKRL